MKLSLMKRFFNTVGEDKRSPVLDLIASRWFKSSNTSILRASANFVAIVQTDKTHYLRFNHETERSISHIQNELEYIKHLRTNGINANNPVLSLSGKLFETVDTDLGKFHAVMFEEVKGEHIESDDLDLEGFQRWGVALGSIHNASHGLELDSQTWSDQLELLTDMKIENRVISQEISAVKSKLANMPKENYGLIVFDFEMDNIKWDNGCLGFMDFDDYCTHWYSADIAYALRDLHGDKAHGFNPTDERVQAFLDGYRSVRPISDEEIQSIPVFIRLHNLYFYARLRRSIGEPEDDDPEWVLNLRKRLQESNRSSLEDMRQNPTL